MTQKYTYLSIILLWIVFFSCSENKSKIQPSPDVLKFYCQYSLYTDPGEYARLYEDLPKSLENLCALIKQQLIHPFELENFAGTIPEDRKNEDQQFPTIASMLEELLKRDGTGLTMSRKPEDRLVVACVHHSMLLASILRYQGIPVRIRAGYAKYIGNDPGLRVSHVICEVWDSENQRWILVDPDRQKVNFPRGQFEFAYETLDKTLHKNLPDAHYFSRYGKNVDRSTIHLICHDLSYVIGDEEPYWKDPSVVFRVKSSIDDLSENERNALANLAGYLQTPDIHLNDLKSIQTNMPIFRFLE